MLYPAYRSRGVGVNEITTTTTLYSFIPFHPQIWKTNIMRAHAGMIFDFDALTAQAHETSINGVDTHDRASAAIIRHPKRAHHTHRRGKPKIITGRLKGLCLPQLCEVEDTSSALIVRHESPWNTYLGSIVCDIAGKVVLASRYTRPSRLVAIREYPKQDARQLVERFGIVRHRNILSVRECYIDADSLYALTDDMPLALSHLVSCSTIYPSEIELASMMAQVSS